MSNPQGYWSAETVGDATRWAMPTFADPADSPPPPPHSADHLDQLELTAYEDGYARGYAEAQAQGYADGAAKIREAVDRLKAVFEHLARPLKDLDGEVERTMIALALEVGRRLAQTTLVQEPAAIAGIIREAIGALAVPARDARIHLHPADADLVRDTLTLPEDYAGWKLVADKELMRGDCRIVTDSAQIDARLDTRAASVAQALLGER